MAQITVVAPYIAQCRFRSQVCQPEPPDACSDAVLTPTSSAHTGVFTLFPTVISLRPRPDPIYKFPCSSLEFLPPLLIPPHVNVRLFLHLLIFSDPFSPPPISSPSSSRVSILSLHSSLAVCLGFYPRQTTATISILKASSPTVPYFLDAPPSIPTRHIANVLYCTYSQPSLHALSRSTTLTIMFSTPLPYRRKPSSAPVRTIPQRITIPSTKSYYATHVHFLASRSSAKHSCFIALCLLHTQTRSVVCTPCSVQRSSTRQRAHVLDTSTNINHSAVVQLRKWTPQP